MIILLLGKPTFSFRRKMRTKKEEIDIIWHCQGIPGSLHETNMSYMFQEMLYHICNK